MAFECPPRLPPDQMIAWSDLEPDYDLMRREREREEQAAQLERDAPSEDGTEIDQNVLDAKLDRCPSPRHRDFTYWTPEYETRRRGKRFLLSPPPTPPHPVSMRPVQTKRKRDPSHQILTTQKYQESQFKPQGVRKAKRVAPRRPRTRSMKPEHVALHPSERGNVMSWFYKGECAIMSYAQYWNDYNWEGSLHAPPRHFPRVEKWVLDQHGRLDVEDEPCPPQDLREPHCPLDPNTPHLSQHPNEPYRPQHQQVSRPSQDPTEPPREIRCIQQEMDNSYELYVGEGL